MYVKHKETGEYFCFSEALMDTGNFVKVESLPAVKAVAAVEAPVVEAPKAPANKHRAPKGK